jgi:hypothetical protein
MSAHYIEQVANPVLLQFRDMLFQQDSALPHIAAFIRGV